MAIDNRTQLFSVEPKVWNKFCKFSFDRWFCVQLTVPFITLKYDIMKFITFPTFSSSAFFDLVIIIYKQFICSLNCFALSKRALELQNFKNWLLFEIIWFWQQTGNDILFVKVWALVLGIFNWELMFLSSQLIWDFKRFHLSFKNVTKFLYEGLGILFLTTFESHLFMMIVSHWSTGSPSFKDS